jgi:hypothetical protein
LKAIKVDVIRRKAGMPPVSQWIAHSRSCFKGEFGLLEKWMSKSDKNFSRGIQLLQIYTLFYAKEVTPKQREKFLSGVLSDPPQPTMVSLAKETIDRGYELLPQMLHVRKLSKPQPLVDMLPSPSKRAPLLDKSVK